MKIVRRKVDWILNRSRDLNRKLSKWNARTFQFMLEYKLKWLGLPVKCINPENSSGTYLYGFQCDC
ncbi:MAG: IS200/IS605 family accessory protein TnpB-related protein [Thermoproteales archaeon]|nr:IS200/IS605 family accessory protein TnpB-related protein [Thermoproteales archaeon]